jgi:hypothetical protein
MTKDEALKLAKECGATTYTNRHYPDATAVTFSPLAWEKFCEQALAAPVQDAENKWRNAAIRVGEDLCSVGPFGYYDMTAEQWLDWALSVVTVHAPPAQPAPVQEPVAWMHTSGHIQMFHPHWEQVVLDGYTREKGWTPLYTTPPTQPAVQEPVGSMGMPLSCGKPLCAPGDHHPLCKLATPPAAPVQPVASLKEVDVLMMAETHGIDPSTKGLYGFYIDCISNQPAAPIPDAITDDSESPKYRAGWNDYRQAMMEMMK